jgi:hypothetical protein
MIDPPRWSRDELESDRLRAIAVFRMQRLQESLEGYARAVDEQREVVAKLLRVTADLQGADEKSLVGVLTEGRYLRAFRYLSGPPVSEDDLRTLAQAQSLAPSRLQAEPEALARVVKVVLGCIDRRRFPWIAEGRDPSDAERDAAALASACLMACQRAQTNRRKLGKERLEGATRQCLAGAGFREAPKRSIALLSDAPGVGEFCGECSCAGRRADFVVGLWDGRHMLIECKDSNSLVNSIKRLNNDTAAKAVFWMRTFGERAVVPAAVIGGVFYLDSLERAQRDGLTLWWGHDMGRLAEWLRSLRASR